ncbi:LPS export ABC transporter periplasmic protein LptC [Candidatus Poribacteria bacterium]|nr:LPS export ABC transporter periplasmic protein LptC [Candidatus Poribacteria bacterium]MXY27651.1 LPS export ABC transporter periplasmic protein LptC [Candidatus Poribacteria bacterium]
MLLIHKNSQKLSNPTFGNTRRSGFGCINGGKPDLSCILTCLGLCLLLCVTGCKSAETPVGTTDESIEAVPTQQLERFATQHTEAGVLKWTLIGDTSTFRGSYVEVENPTVEIFEDGVVSLTLNSKKGKQFLTGSEKDNLHLSGEVVGVSKDGTLYSELLHWQNRAGRLYAPDEVTLVRGDSTWVGTEMYANPTLETVKMKNNQFKLYPKDEKTDEYHKTSVVPE